VKEREFGDFLPGRYAWKLRNPRPVAMTGRLTLFEIADSLVYVDNRIMSPRG
jgi:hypothetical protein